MKAQNSSIMEILKKRKFAVTITVVAAIAATLFGVGRSMARLSRDIEQTFFDGVYLEDGGYVQPSIDSQLAKYEDAALGLATILNKNPELADDAETVLKRRRDLINAEGISDKSLAFRLLSGSVYNLSKAALETDMGQRDTEAVSQYVSTINGAESFINNAAYNQSNSTRWNEQSFITRLIRLLVHVKEPEMF